MFKLPQLPYSYDAFGKNISSDLMKLHHDNHHRIYVEKLNSALALYPNLMSKTVDELVRDYKQLSPEIQTAVRNFGGGHLNHSIFWQCITPNSSMKPNGTLMDEINIKYGSFEIFTEQFNIKAMSLFGSGWTWLLADLSIVNLPNQDNPISEGLAEPILCVDVWEHAFYLDYTYKRAELLAAFWNIVIWDEVGRRYDEFSR
jgi:Fe-Mn family superoxide dismutase